jgi:hypothetical protein
MKNLLKILLLVLLVNACTTEEKNKSKFEIVKSETKKDLDIIQTVLYSDDYIIDTKYDQKKIIKENKIISAIEYKYKNMGIFERDIKRYSYITRYYNENGNETKLVFNENYEEININKKRNLIYTVWEENKLIIKEYNQTKTKHNELIQYYSVENGKGTLIKETYTDTTGTENTAEHFKNKIIFTGQKGITFKKEKTIWEWKKDNEGNVNNLTIKEENGEYEVFQIEWENKKPKKTLIKKSNGTITEKTYKWDGIKKIETTTYENNGYDWFTVDRYQFNTLNLITKIEHYTVDKFNYKEYCDGKKVNMFLIESLSSEMEYFTKDKPFEQIK